MYPLLEMSVERALVHVVRISALLLKAIGRKMFFHLQWHV